MLFSLPLASSEHLDYLDLIDAFHHLQSLDLELYHATFFLIRRKTRVKLEFIAYLESILAHFGSQSRCRILEGIHVLLHSFLLDSYLFTRNVELTSIFGLLIGCLIALEDSFEVVMLFEDMQVVGEQMIVLSVISHSYFALKQLQPALVGVDLLFMEEIITACAHY